MFKIKLVSLNTNENHLYADQIPLINFNEKHQSIKVKFFTLNKVEHKSILKDENLLKFIYYYY